MRYLVLTYVRKPSGQIDESMTIVKNLKRRDWQMANVILDFKDQKVLLGSMDGKQVTKDWDKVVSYYYQFYAHTIERLFEENGHALNITAESTLVDEKTE